jgi:hypothetical protein
MEVEAIIRAVESQRNHFMNENIRLQIIVEEQQRTIQELQKQLVKTEET